MLDEWGGEEPESNLLKANNRTCHFYILSSLHYIHTALLFLVKTLPHRKIPKFQRLPLSLSYPDVPHIVHKFHCQRRKITGLKLSWTSRWHEHPQTYTHMEAMRAERRNLLSPAQGHGAGLSRTPQPRTPALQRRALQGVTCEKTVGTQVVLRNTQFTNTENPSFSKIRQKRPSRSTFLTRVISRPRWHKFSLWVIYIRN